jgi:ABC-type multidrug transport system ATPase subunit
MGPTGSGKTSLLNVLAHRCPVVKGASLTGTLLVNDSQVDPKAFSHLTSYVQQDDAMFSALTVKETLMTAAHFQLPSAISQSEKDDYVDSIINELGLNKCRDTIIGDAKERGVSGGGEDGRRESQRSKCRFPSLIACFPPLNTTLSRDFATATLVARRAQEGEHWG